jgi:hypothetical protein
LGQRDFVKDEGELNGLNQKAAQTKDQQAQAAQAPQGDAP